MVFRRDDSVGGNCFMESPGFRRSYSPSLSSTTRPRSAAVTSRSPSASCRANRSRSYTITPLASPDSSRAISASQPGRLTRGFQALLPSSTHTSPTGSPRSASTARHEATGAGGDGSGHGRGAGLSRKRLSTLAFRPTGY